eukprot:s1491_g6.t1
MGDTNCHQTAVNSISKSSSRSKCRSVSALKIERVQRQGQDKSDGPNAKGKSFSLPSWPPWDVSEAGISPFQASSSQALTPMEASNSATLQEMAVQLLRIAYQDPDSRPQDVQALLDKADKEAGRTNIKSIHAATRSLDKAQKTLQDSVAAKKNHRLLWTQHVAEGIKVWEAQLESYRVHQANLAEQAARARAEIAQARRIIQELSDKAVKGGNTAIPQPIREEVEEAGADIFDDPEEQKLRSALQGVLNACAGSLGIATDQNADKGVQEISDDDKEKKQHHKRPRSSDPPFRVFIDVVVPDVPKYPFETHVADVLLTTRPALLSVLVSLQINLGNDAYDPREQVEQIYKIAGPLEQTQSLHTLQPKISKIQQLRNEGFGLTLEDTEAPDQAIRLFNGRCLRISAQLVQGSAHVSDDDLAVLLDITNLENVRQRKSRKLPRSKEIDCPPLSLAVSSSLSNLYSEAVFDQSSFSIFEDDEVERSDGAPLSMQAVLSSPTYEVSNSAGAGLQVFDQTVLMQIDSLKQSPYTNEQDNLWQAFHAGHAQPDDQAASDDSVSNPAESSGYTPSIGQEEPQIGPREEDPNMQDVFLFRRHGQPVRVLLPWHDYHVMMRYIAWHFFQERGTVVDAYELSVPLPDVPDDIAVAIVHFLHDVPVGHVAKHVLIDIEIHGHKIEPHFRSGPLVRRTVEIIPAQISRHGLLAHMNVDQYCHLEGGRCLAYHNLVRWADWDEAMRDVKHGDYFKISLPPSESYECSTDQLLVFVQRGCSNDEILEQLSVYGAPEGYSPSPLSPDEVRQLRTEKN